VKKLGTFLDALQKAKKNNLKSKNEVFEKKRKNFDKINEKTFTLKKTSNNKCNLISNNKCEDIHSEINDENVFSLYDPKIINNHHHFDKNLVTLLRPQSFEAEQFRILKSKIFYSNCEIKPRSFIITSAIPDEGKSFIAGNFAVSIAQNLNEHVLIVDCDMRNACIHKQFGFRDVPGLSEYLSNDIPLQSLFLKTPLSKLSILPAGSCPPNPYELLSSNRMISLLEELKSRYSDRYIIIDSPPPKLTAETTAISNFVDGILLVVEYGRTPINLVKEVVEILGKHKISCIIFNKYYMRFCNYYGYGKYTKHNGYYECFE
jgi:capsular exopolysaccharide synthesis family protein